MNIPSAKDLPVLRSATRNRRRLAICALAAALATACGGARSSPSPAPGSSPTSQPTAQASPSPLTDVQSANPTITIYGADSGDFAEGTTALDSGDFNGDGLADLLIGAANAAGPEEGRIGGGEAYIILGRDDPPDQVHLGQEQYDTIIYGAATGDTLGFSVLAADLNADGLDDVIVGAPGVTAGEDPRTDQGRAYVIFGSKRLSRAYDLSEDPYDFVVTGAEGFSRVGHAMASGDVNGDDVTDLILGAPFAGREPGTPPGSPRKEAGEVYVIFGSPTLTGEVSIPSAQQGFTVSNEQRYSLFGAAVAAGDVNGDGIDDIIIGAQQMSLAADARDATGAAYVFFGARDLAGRLFIRDGDQDVAIVGAEPGDALGFPVAVGDVNGDGVDDVIVSARGGGGPGNARPAAGETYVLFGGDDLQGTIELAKDPPDITISGPRTAYLLPLALATADVNSDGAADLLLTTTLGTDERLGAGAVLLVLGQKAPPSTIDLAAGGYALALAGNDGDDRLGAALAVVPATDKETGLLIMATGAGGPDNEEPDSGEIYLIPIAPP